MNREEQINNFLGGRGLNFIVLGILVVAVILNASSGCGVDVAGDIGWCMPSCGEWLEQGALSAIVNAACIVAAGYLLRHLNHLHGFIRANASISLSAFLLLEIATPGVVSYFYEGTAMLVVTVVMAYILFGTYHERISQRSTYLAFALVGFYAMFQFSALYLAVVLFLGFVQMRVMRLRNFIAMLLGVLTPYWIAYGFGAITVDSFAVPPLGEPLDEPWPLIATCAVTALVTLILMMSNMVRIISYNAKRRACNGFFSVLTVATIIMACVDYNNLLVYLPLLNLCLSLQVGHAFTISNNSRRYIPALALCAVCLGVYVYNMFFANL